MIGKPLVLHDRRCVHWFKVLRKKQVLHDRRFLVINDRESFKNILKIKKKQLECDFEKSPDQNDPKTSKSIWFYMTENLKLEKLLVLHFKEKFPEKTIFTSNGRIFD